MMLTWIFIIQIIQKLIQLQKCRKYLIILIPAVFSWKSKSDRNYTVRFSAISIEGIGKQALGSFQFNNGQDNDSKFLTPLLSRIPLL
jgi:hypothetical protein